MSRDRNRNRTEEWDAVIAAFAEEGEAARCGAPVPSAAIVWWRAQLRARHEAEAAVARPMTVVQAIAIASTAGLVLALSPDAGTWLRDTLRAALGWSSGIAAVGSLLAWPAAIALTMGLVGSLAVYLITADD